MAKRRRGETDDTPEDEPRFFSTRKHSAEKWPGFVIERRDLVEL